jgi:hypothetical protein
VFILFYIYFILFLLSHRFISVVPGAEPAKDKGKEKEKDEAEAGDAEKAIATKQELQEEDIAGEGDPTSSLQNLQPNIPKDYELFLNLVEFCKMVLLVEASTKSSASGTQAEGSASAVKREPTEDDDDLSVVKKEDGSGTKTHDNRFI